MTAPSLIRPQQLESTTLCSIHYRAQDDVSMNYHSDKTRQVHAVHQQIRLELLLKEIENLLPDPPTPRLQAGCNK